MSLADLRVLHGSGGAPAPGGASPRPEPGARRADRRRVLRHRQVPLDPAAALSGSVRELGWSPSACPLPFAWRGESFARMAPMLAPG